MSKRRANKFVRLSGSNGKKPVTDAKPSPFRPVVGVLLERTIAHADKVFFNFLGIAQQGFPFITMNYGRTDLIRNKMALSLLRSHYTHLIMLDIDHVHPVDIVQRLMQNFVDDPSLRIVGGLNFRRGEPYDPCAFIRTDEGKFLPMSDWPQGLVRVDALGTGCIAIAREVFEQIDPPWFFNNYDERLIWRDIWQGEDMGFAEKCRAHGIAQYVDTRVTSPHLIDAVVSEDSYREYIQAKGYQSAPIGELRKEYAEETPA